MYLYYQTKDQAYGKWVELSPKSSVNPNTWSQLTGSLTLSRSPDVEAYLMVFGLDRNIDLHVDVSFVKKAE